MRNQRKPRAERKPRAKKKPLPTPEEEAANTRQCIATRELLPKEAMIRFVVGPDDVVVPDLANKLPGRGMWVKASREAVAEAAAKRLFSKAAKKQVQLPESLVGQVEMLLRKRVLEALAMARKAGLLVNGHEKVLKVLVSNEGACLLHADDAGENGVRELNNKARELPIFQCFSRDELSQVTAHPNPVHVVLKKGGPAEYFITHARRFTGFS
jgi:predicted RNA-binding protein YlxR (DUF448 family)